MGKRHKETQQQISEAIEVSGLTKIYDEWAVGDNISFEIEAGEVIGLVGPNGAGKKVAGKKIHLVRRVMSMQEEIKASSKSNLDFRLMSLTYKFRDFFLPPMSILKEVGIEAGFHVLDFGCGPGSYIIPLAELVGESGKIYALDVLPLAIQTVRRVASRRQMMNVQTILSDCQTGLPPDSVDVVLLYDTLHHLDNPNGVLAEFHRVLRPKGILSISDHHMKQDEIISRATNTGFFKLSAKAKRTYSFSREE